MQTLGLIGFGQFGQLAARHLAGRFDVLVSDVRPAARAQAKHLGVAFGSFAEAAAREIVVVAVPVVAMREVFGQIAPHLKPGALVIDVGSVKSLPSEWMIELLPPHVDLVATHPLFGPQSAKESLDGLRMVVCPVRGGRHDCVAAFARDLGLTVSITSAEEHDREMAYVQALTHLIGRSLVNLNIPDEQLKTRSYQHLLELCALIGEDSFELFAAIQTLNPYAREVADAFVAEAESLLDQVDRGDMKAQRLEAFTDGVIAIIITISVLELRIPAGHALADLRGALPTLGAYALAFTNVGLYWNNHHHMLHASERVDGRVLWANLFLLFWLSLAPFVISWMDESHFAALPTAAYGLVFLMAGVAYVLLQTALIGANGGRDSALARALGGDWKGKASMAAYLAAIGLAFLQPLIAIAIYLAVAGMWFIPDRRIEKALVAKG